MSRSREESPQDASTGNGAGRNNRRNRRRNKETEDNKNDDKDPNEEEKEEQNIDRKRRSRTRSKSGSTSRPSTPPPPAPASSEPPAKRRKESDEPSVKCPLCSARKKAATFPKEADLWAHYVNTHFKDKLYEQQANNAFKCLECPASIGTLKSKGALLEHCQLRHVEHVQKWIQDEIDKLQQRKVNGKRAKTSGTDRIKCKLCQAALPNRDRLKRHAIDKHFKDEIGKLLSKTKPFKCPEGKCQYEGDNFSALVTHYGPEHNVIDKFMSQVEEKGESEVKKVNGDEVDKSGNGKEMEQEMEEDEKSQSPVPSSQGRTRQGTRNIKQGTVNNSMEEFKRNIKENIRTLDGQCAEVIDERTVKCVCGKAIRLSSKFYWRYLLQKPTVQNGVVQQKGHWFTCPVVVEKGSHIPPLKVSEEEIEASRRSSRRGSLASEADSEGDCNSTASTPNSKRRSVRVSEKEEAVSVSVSASPVVQKKTTKVSNNANEEAEASQFNMERHIRDLLNTRVPGETFLQDGPCFQMGDVSMCHMCKGMSMAERKAMLIQGRFDEEECDISCCFYAFRKLKCTKAGNLAVAGFLDAKFDPKEKDFELWKTTPENPPSIPLEKVFYILGLIGDQFCDMVQQERQCLNLLQGSKDKQAVVWKPPVKGVREMCDACQTTLFNCHWTCGRCGIVICIDCYQFRRTGLVKDVKRTEDTDEYDWPMCNNGDPHIIEKLCLAQIIPSKTLVEMSKKLHHARLKWNITQFCHKQEEFTALFSEEGMMKSGVRKNT